MCLKVVWGRSALRPQGSLELAGHSRRAFVSAALKPYPLLGHLPFWAGDPLALLEGHAANGDFFELRLGAPHLREVIPFPRMLTRMKP